MARALDQELEKLLVGTNDLRRRAGQAFYHFYRTLVFWGDKGLSFEDTTRVWMGAGAAIFRLTAASVESAGEQVQDVPLRAYIAKLLTQLAEDLERGDHTRMAFLRWLEARFPELTQMMQREVSAAPIYDGALARDLSHAFVVAAGGNLATMTGHLRDTAAALTA